jgi:hypothetical protein
VGPRAGLDFMEERKIPCLYRKSNPKFFLRTARSLVAMPAELSIITVEAYKVQAGLTQR